MHTNNSESAAWVEHCAIFSIVEPYALRTVIGKYVCLAYISASVVYAYVHDAGVVHGNSKQESTRVVCCVTKWLLLLANESVT